MIVSVCMATFNGEKYIKNQLQTILSQLRHTDELIISDDSSTDDTLDIVRSFKDSRIRIYENCDFHSPVLNFENALKKSRGDIIILSDQDDEWLPGRIENAISILTDSSIDLVVCRSKVMNTKGIIISESYFEEENPVNHSLLINLLNNPYFGNSMAFTRRVLDTALPFPKNIAMHDIWIGILAQAYFKCIYTSEAFIVYRSHQSSFTYYTNFSLYFKLKYRLKILWEVLKRGFETNPSKIPLLIISLFRK